MLARLPPFFCKAKRCSRLAASSAPLPAAQSPRHTLVLYTRQDCSLCAALEAALHSALEAASYRADGELRAAVLVTVTLADGAVDGAAAAMASQVPLLRRRGRDGRESALPRSPPRTTAVRLAALLERELAAAAAADDEADDAGGEAPWAAATQGFTWVEGDGGSVASR